MVSVLGGAAAVRSAHIVSHRVARHVSHGTKYLQRRMPGAATPIARGGIGRSTPHRTGPAAGRPPLLRTAKIYRYASHPRLNIKYKSYRHVQSAPAGSSTTPTPKTAATKAKRAARSPDAGGPAHPARIHMARGVTAHARVRVPTGRLYFYYISCTACAGMRAANAHRARRGALRRRRMRVPPPLVLLKRLLEPPRASRVGWPERTARAATRRRGPARLQVGDRGPSRSAHRAAGGRGAQAKPRGLHQLHEAIHRHSRGVPRAFSTPSSSPSSSSSRPAPAELPTGGGLSGRT